jgi:hypothetical protein
MQNTIKPVSFKVSKKDRALIEKIVARTAALVGNRGGKIDRLCLTMDITAVHANGNRLRLADLAMADDFNVLHDVGGIHRHIDRETGKLGDCFLPRFTQQRKPKWLRAADRSPL